MSSIDARIAALAEAIKRRAMEQEAPVDPLSLSLEEFQNWLAALDEAGRAELLEELNSPSEDGTAGLDLDAEALERFIADFGEV